MSKLPHVFALIEYRSVDECGCANGLLNDWWGGMKLLWCRAITLGQGNGSSYLSGVTACWFVSGIKMEIFGNRAELNHQDGVYW